MLRFLIGLILLGIPWLVWGAETEVCARTLRELGGLLGDPSFARQWSEVSMDDGKPLIISIGERDGQLQFAFIKTSEGLWAELSGVLCRAGDALELKVAREQVQLGPAAHWGFGMAFASGGVFTFRQHAPDQLQIATRGWKGSFLARRAD